MNTQRDGGFCTIGMKGVNWRPGHEELGRDAMGLKSCAGSLIEEIAHACRSRWAHQLDSAC